MVGVTSPGDQFPSTTALHAYQSLHRQGRLPLRITFTVHCPTLPAVQAFLRYGLETGFGDKWLKFGAVKFFVDGGITGAAGAFYEPYTHQPESRGHLKLEQDELNAMVRALDGAGVQASIHVVGDRARHGAGRLQPVRRSGEDAASTGARGASVHDTGADRPAARPRHGTGNDPALPFVLRGFLA
jgi:predicted amidohydrolase YtcJ